MGIGKIRADKSNSLRTLAGKISTITARGANNTVILTIIIYLIVKHQMRLLIITIITDSRGLSQREKTKTERLGVPSCSNQSRPKSMVKIKKGRNACPRSIGTKIQQWIF